MLHRRTLRAGVLAAACVSAAAGCSSLKTKNTGYAHSTQPPIVEETPADESGGGWLWRRSGPKDPNRVHLAYAHWQEQVGHAEVARQSYRAVLDRDPKSVDALLGLARLDQLAGREIEADLNYQKALQLNPNDPQVLDAYGQFLAARDDWERAVETLNLATDAAPDQSVYRFHLAVALVHAGKTTAAMPHFTRSIGEAEGHYNIGYILYQQGKLAESEEQFFQALTKKPQLTQAQDMLDRVRQERGGTQLAASPVPTQTPPQAAQQTTTARHFDASIQQTGAVAAPATVTSAANWSTNESQPSPVPHPWPSAPTSQPQSTAEPVRQVPMASPSLPPNWSGMTPQQREQWSNQLKAQ